MRAKGKESGSQRREVMESTEALAVVQAAGVMSRTHGQSAVAWQ